MFYESSSNKSITVGWWRKHPSAEVAVTIMVVQIQCALGVRLLTRQLWARLSSDSYYGLG
jgi:hypothetical protein